MLQRIQTYYLGIIILIQVVAVSGMDFVRISTENNVYEMNAWGVTRISLKEIGVNTIPVFVVFILIALLAFWCLSSYKNLDRQLKLGRILFYIYCVSVLTLFILASFGEVWMNQEVISKEIGLPYWLFICGLPLAFLANTGIKRDKRLLDSLKRL